MVKEFLLRGDIIYLMCVFLLILRGGRVLLIELCFLSTQINRYFVDIHLSLKYQHPL